jgi:predicted Zn-dependent protease
VIRFLLSTVIFLSTSSLAYAQFRLDLNRMMDAAKNVAKATRDIGQDEEIAIGKDLAATLLGAAPLVNDARMQRYVNNVGRWIASQSERPDLPWQFGVLDAPQLNAFAVPGGTVFITRGLLERMRSEAELAGVLGHEIVHVVKKHHLKAIQKGAQTALAGEAVSMATQNRNAAVNAHVQDPPRARRAPRRAEREDAADPRRLLGPAAAGRALPRRVQAGEIAYCCGGSSRQGAPEEARQEP